MERLDHGQVVGVPIFRNAVRKARVQVSEVKQVAESARGFGPFLRPVPDRGHRTVGNVPEPDRVAGLVPDLGQVPLVHHIGHELVEAPVLHRAALDGLVHAVIPARDRNSAEGIGQSRYGPGRPRGGKRPIPVEVPPDVHEAPVFGVIDVGGR